MRSRAGLDPVLHSFWGNFLEGCRNHGHGAGLPVRVNFLRNDALERLSEFTRAAALGEGCGAAARAFSPVYHPFPSNAGFWLKTNTGGEGAGTFAARFRCRRRCGSFGDGVSGPRQRVATRSKLADPALTKRYSPPALEPHLQHSDRNPKSMPLGDIDCRPPATASISAI